MKTPFRRSWLCVPANRKEWYERLAGLDADALVLDLEDGVPEALKETARETLISSAAKTEAFQKKGFFVRVNAIETPFFSKDLKAVLRSLPDLDGIVLPKVRGADDILKVDAALKGTDLEIVPILELLEAEQNAVKILQASPRIRCVHFAESGDYGLEFGLFTRHFDAMIDPVAAQFALTALKAAKMTGKEIADGAYLDIGDLEGLKKRCLWAREIGFDGKVALHPKQATIINRWMTPDPETKKMAREIVRTYEQNLASSSFVPLKGSFITPPKYEAAKRFLKKHGG